MVVFAAKAREREGELSLTRCEGGRASRCRCITPQMLISLMSAMQISRGRRRRCVTDVTLDPETAEITGGICAPSPMQMLPMFVARSVTDGGIDKLLLRMQAALLLKRMR